MVTTKPATAKPTKMTVTGAQIPTLREMDAQLEAGVVVVH